MKDNITYLIAPYKVDGIENTTIEDCANYLSGLKLIGLDIETTRNVPEGMYVNEKYHKPGLDPYLSDVVMVQVGDLKKRFVIDVRHYNKEQLSPVLNILHYNKDVTIIGQNIRFDGKHLRHKYGIRLHTVYDTMICEMILWNGIGMRFGLADMAGRYLGINKVDDLLLFDEMYKKVEVTLDQELLEENEHMITPFEIEEQAQIDKSTRLEFLHIKDRPFTKRQIDYGSDDIVHPILIMERQLIGRKISENDIYLPKLCFKIENSFTQVLADIEYAGMQVDKEAWLSIEKENKEKYDIHKKKLDDYVVSVFPKYGQSDLFSDTPICTIQWTSPKQVIKFFRELDICGREFSKQTKREEWSVGAVAMLKKLSANYKKAYYKLKWMDFDVDERGNHIRDDKKMVLAYLILGKINQNLTTFGSDWLQYVHPITGKIHPSFRQILNTTRISSTNPNSQQIPGNQAFRKCFIAGEGNVMICADYKSEESRVIADRCGDTNMINFFLEGDEFFGSDYHSWTSTRVKRVLTGDPNAVTQPKELKDGSDNPYFKEQDAEERQNAKETGFGLAYGKGARAFAENFGWEKEVAEDFIDNYYKAFPSLKEYFEECHKEVDEKGYITISDKSGVRWFSTFTDRINKLQEEGMQIYKDAGLFDIPKEERAEFKQKLKEDNPRVKEVWREWSSLRGSNHRRSQNYKIQGISGQIGKLSGCMIRHELIRKQLPADLINMVHDEFGALTKKEYGEEVAEIVKRNMIDGGNFFCNINIMDVDAKIGNYWAH